jgi:hypothetical protein
MNAAMQCLATCAPLTAYFRKCAPLYADRTSRVVQSFALLIRELYLAKAYVSLSLSHAHFLSASELCIVLPEQVFVIVPVTVTKKKKPVVCVYRSLCADDTFTPRTLSAAWAT